MTLLNEIPIKGTALDVFSGSKETKWKKARAYYILQGKTGEVAILVQFIDKKGKYISKGSGGLVIIEHKNQAIGGYLILQGYFRPYEYETNKNLRGM